MVSNYNSDTMMEEYVEATKGPNGEPGVVIVHIGRGPPPFAGAHPRAGGPAGAAAARARAIEIERTRRAETSSRGRRDVSPGELVFLDEG